MSDTLTLTSLRAPNLHVLLLLPFLDVFSFLDRALGGFYVLSLMPCCLTPGHLGPSEIHQKSNQMDTQVVGSHNNRRQNH